MKKIIIHGAYKGDNFGDTLLLLILLEEFNNHDCKILLSNVCEKTFKRCSKFKNVQIVSSLTDLSSADALIYGGGGYFGEQPTNRIGWYLRFIKNHLFIGYYLKFICKKPIAFLGVEFGELKNPIIRWIAIFLLNKAEIIAARNKGSFKWLKKNTSCKNIFQTADLALNIRDYSSYDKDEILAEGSEILIHPSFKPETDPVSYAMLESLSAIDFKKSKHEISLILDRDGNETESLIDSWTKALPNTIYKIYRYSNPLQVCSIIKNAGCIISNKLHTTIVAASFGLRVISIAKHPKNKRFFYDIERLDLHISHDAFNEEAFKKLLGLLQKNELEPINLKEDIYNRARINFQLVDKFLKII